MEEIVKGVLEKLDSLGVKYIVIGSWAVYFFRHIHPGFEYNLRTLDMDICIEEPAEVDVKSAMSALGFEAMTKGDYTIFSHPNIEVEFITTDNPDVMGIRVATLPHVRILLGEVEELKLWGMNIKIPAPHRIFIHKLLIIREPWRRGKRAKDIEQITAIVPITDMGKMKRTFLELSVDERRKVIASIKSLIRRYGLLSPILKELLTC
jgi:hypothetical protein